jgi:RNA polymerase sigma-70 factor, ECF subfamily
MKPTECGDSGARTTLLDNLSQRQREIIRLRVVVGLSARETADRLGMAPAAVRRAQHTALDLLRAALREAPKI